MSEADAARAKPLLFDCNCMIGHRAAGAASSFTTPNELLREMDRAGIDEALVYHADSVEHGPEVGNQHVLEAVTGQSRLHPVWVAAPETVEPYGGAEGFVTAMLDSGVRLVRLFPGVFAHQLRAWSLGDLLQVCAVRRVPLMLDYSAGHWMTPAIDWDGIHEVSNRWPDLSIIIVRASIGSPRCLYPLMALHPGVCIETSYFQPQGGLEFVARRFGAHRIMLGTGMPEWAPGPPLAMLASAALSQQEREMIGGGNLRRLLEGVG